LQGEIRLHAKVKIEIMGFVLMRCSMWYASGDARMKKNIHDLARLWLTGHLVFRLIASEKDMAVTSSVLCCRILNPLE
jgi:hypothetical protein